MERNCEGWLGWLRVEIFWQLVLVARSHYATWDECWELAVTVVFFSVLKGFLVQKFWHPFFWRVFSSLRFWVGWFSFGTWRQFGQDMFSQRRKKTENPSWNQKHAATRLDSHPFPPIFIDFFRQKRSFPAKLLKEPFFFCLISWLCHFQCIGSPKPWGSTPPAVTTVANENFRLGSPNPNTRWWQLKVIFHFHPQKFGGRWSHSHFLMDDGRALLFWSRLVGKKLLDHPGWVFS